MFHFTFTLLLLSIKLFPASNTYEIVSILS